MLHLFSILDEEKKHRYKKIKKNSVKNSMKLLSLQKFNSTNIIMKRSLMKVNQTCVLYRYIHKLFVIYEYICRVHAYRYIHKLFVISRKVLKKTSALPVMVIHIRVFYSLKKLY